MYGLQVYKWLLKMYPKSFREEYGDEMAQVFADCCHDAYRTNGTSGLIRWWITGLSDLTVNLIKAWWTQSGKARLFRPSNLLIPIGITSLVLTWVALLWGITMLTVFLLIPWDIGIRPLDTLASSVDAFFQANSGSMWLPGLVAVAVSIRVFIGGIRSWYLSYLRVYIWRFVSRSILIIIAGGLVAGAGMFVLQKVFPNHSTFEGDQSYSMSLVYFGLLLIGCLILAPLRFQKRLLPEPHELATTQPDSAL